MFSCFVNDILSLLASFHIVVCFALSATWELEALRGEET